MRIRIMQAEKTADSRKKSAFFRITNSNGKVKVDFPVKESNGEPIWVQESTIFSIVPDGAIEKLFDLEDELASANA